jgi:hypothetical protein
MVFASATEPQTGVSLLSALDRAFTSIYIPAT